MATATKPAPAAETEAAAPAAPPIHLSLSAAETRATFHGTQIEFTDKQVVIHTNDPISLEPADEEAKSTKGTLDIVRPKDSFNYFATRGVKITKEKDNSLTVSADTKETKVKVQAIPAP